MKTILKLIILLLVICALIVGGYVLYLFITYNRIDDNMELEVGKGASLPFIKVGEENTIVTQNIGFGAYSDDFTFFMDGGTESRARSKDAVLSNTNGIIEQIQELSPDIVLFQEVDLKSTRSYKVDQLEIIRENFPEFDWTDGVNYNSGYLFYPILEPHGKSVSSIAMFSKFNVDSGIRRSLPVSTGFSKFFDLDRCYTISRIPVDNGKNLNIYNVHLSAYGGSPEIRDGQIDMLLKDIEEDINNGDYVICGGDFNHDFTGNSRIVLNQGEFDFGWAQPFPIEKLSENVNMALNYTNNKFVPTSRNTDIPYQEGVSFVVIIDGYLVSNNIEYTYLENIDNKFKYTDHNPVLMKFTLN